MTNFNQNIRDLSNHATFHLRHRFNCDNQKTISREISTLQWFQTNLRFYRSILISEMTLSQLPEDGKVANLLTSIMEEDEPTNMDNFQQSDLNTGLFGTGLSYWCSWDCDRISLESNTDPPGLSK